MAMLSSPRMWGCFCLCYRSPGEHRVFPTHVGVFLTLLSGSTILRCLPHACGGVSESKKFFPLLYVSSPRMWGCFLGTNDVGNLTAVFPTHVGVFPLEGALQVAQKCLPHACGGVSGAQVLSEAIGKSSPRMWGCFCRL